jgi:HK97 gp10 family phage protein
MSGTVEIKGLKELAEALKQMPERIAGKALGASVASGAAIIREAARANAPENTGATKKSIVVWRKRGSQPYDITYCVGVTMRKKWLRSFAGGLFYATRKYKGQTVFKSGVKQPAYWWMFNEFGTSKQAAKPFMRPAFAQQGGRALAAIKMMLEKAVVIAADACPKYQGR